jgi:hypothetical protein
MTRPLLQRTAAITDRMPVRSLILAIALLLTACEREESPTRASQTVDASGHGQAVDSRADEIARLQALGYVDVVDAAPPVLTGVGIHDATRVGTGLTYFTTSFDCTARLITTTGDTVRSWTAEPCTGWSNTVLLPQGDVLVVQRYKRRGTAMPGGLLKLGFDGTLLWRVDVPVHHDVEPMYDGRITALTHRWRVIPWIDPERAVDDHFITILGPEGHILEEASIAELLRSAPDVFQFLDIAPTPVRRTGHASRKTPAEEIDLVHANSIAWMKHSDLAATNPIYATTNVVVSMRHQNTIAIFDWAAKRVIWAWGQGHIMGPHDATPLPDGNLLIFDNGLGRGWSRVIELDPRSREIVWQYKADPPEDFYTLGRGSAQRLANGNTLITESDQGRIFEVTRDGTVVWNYANPSRTPDGHTMAIVRARRVQERPRSADRFDVSD